MRYSPNRRQYTWFQWKSYFALLQRAWQIEIYKSQQGWDFTMSVYAYVSADSPVARCAESGDVEGLQSLLVNGQASPFTLIIDFYYDDCFNSLLDVCKNHIYTSPYL